MNIFSNKVGIFVIISVLILLFAILVRFTAFNWWAASFNGDANQGLFETRGNIFFGGLTITFLSLIYFIVRLLSSFRPK